MLCTSKLQLAIVLYDPRIKAGMTVAGVKVVLPDVSAWVRKVNNLPE